MPYKKEYYAVELTSHQKHIVIGSLLGNSFIVSPPTAHHCYFAMRQSKKKDIRIISYKANELQNLQSRFGILEGMTATDRDYRWRSYSHPLWDEYKRLAYRKKQKKITMEWLDVISGESLMMWVLESGFAIKKDNTHCLGLDISSSVVKKYFCEVGMPCEAEIINGKKRLVFDVLGSKKLIATIGSYLPSFITDKEYPFYIQTLERGRPNAVHKFMNL